MHFNNVMKYSCTSEFGMYNIYICLIYSILVLLSVLYGINSYPTNPGAKAALVARLSASGSVWQSLPSNHMHQPWGSGPRALLMPSATSPHSPMCQSRQQLQLAYTGIAVHQCYNNKNYQKTIFGN